MNTDKEQWCAAVQASIDVLALAASMMGEGVWEAQYWHYGKDAGWSTSYTGPALFVLGSALSRSPSDGLRFFRSRDGKLLVWKHPEVLVYDEDECRTVRQQIDGYVL